MATKDTLSDSMGHLWNQLADGWQHLRDRTTRALTRFSRHPKPNDPDDVALPRTGWALLPVDIQETDRELVVSLEAPGLEKEDIQIEVHGDQLLVKGEKHYQHSGERGHYHIHECAYGLFQRLVPLPTAVEEDGTSASYKRGVLTITLPKQKSQQRRRITIQ